MFGRIVRSVAVLTFVATSVLATAAEASAKTTTSTSSSSALADKCSGKGDVYVTGLKNGAFACEWGNGHTTYCTHAKSNNCTTTVVAPKVPVWQQLRPVTPVRVLP